MYNENQASYLQLLERAKLPNLMNRRLQDICILMYKVLYKLCPSYIFNIFKEHSSKYNLRQSDFFTPRYNSVSYSIGGKDCAELIEIACMGCILCST